MRAAFSFLCMVLCILCLCAGFGVLSIGAVALASHAALYVGSCLFLAGPVFFLFSLWSE